MKIVDVEAMVLDTGKDYSDPNVAAEAHGAWSQTAVEQERAQG